MLVDRRVREEPWREELRGGTATRRGLACVIGGGRGGSVAHWLVARLYSVHIVTSLLYTRRFLLVRGRVSCGRGCSSGD